MSSTSSQLTQVELGRTNSLFSEKDSVASEEVIKAQVDFPDGGLRAWLVVVAGMCTTIATFGYANSWGVFQSYYQTHVLVDSSPSSISWIGSIQYAFIILPALILGRLFDLGYFQPIFFASCALVVGSTFLLAEAKAYWQFLLCQGIIAGLGGCGIFSPVMPIIAQWFKERRALAVGFTMMGSSLGGMTLPIIAKILLAKTSFQWTMRAFGFLLLILLTIANLLLKPRFPPSRKSGSLIDLRAFKSPAYLVYCTSGFLCFLGIYSVLIYVGVAALSIGVSQTYGFYLVAIINASSFVGRYGAGLLADRFGSLNIMIPCTTIAAILIYAWPFVKSQRDLTIVSVLYGYFSGIYISLTLNPAMEMGKMEEVGNLSGIYLSCLSVGAMLGPPLCGVIIEVTGGYKGVGYFAGSCVILGVCMMQFTRQMLLKQGRTRC